MASNRSGIQTKTNPSKIIGIQFSILSPEEIRKSSVAEIVSRDTYVNNKPVIGGLFDPRMGVLDPGLICPTDGLDYMQTPGYFGHIELARPVFYIQYLNTILKILRCICFKCSKLLINKEKYKKSLEIESKKRWDYIFSLASKVSRCGDENDDGCGCKQPDKIKKEGLATIIVEWNNLEDEESEKQKISMKLSTEQISKIFKRITDDDVSFMGFSPKWSRPEWMICEVLAVPPPSVRPSIKHDAHQRSEDDLSNIIVNIIKANKSLQDKINQNADANVIEDWTTMVQFYIATMINNKLPGVAPTTQRSGRALKSIVDRLNGKTGRVRGNLMGKRVDYSARSVITPDANLSIKQLGIPLKIAMNITYPDIVNDRNKDFLTKLMLNGPDTYPGANILQRKNGDNISLRYVDRNSIVLENGDKLHRHMVDGDPILFNRQPTLHRMSMMAHIAKVMKEGNTFRMNVGDTKPYNADFDGDEMNMHNPQSDEAKSELLNLAAVPRQIISPGNNQAIIGIFQDSLLGSFRFTRENINFNTRDAMNLLMNYNKLNPKLFENPDKTISSFEILSQILPPMSAYFKNGRFDDDIDDKKTSNNMVDIVNGKYIRGQMDKDVLGAKTKGLIQSIFNDFGYNAAADFIDDLQNIITEYMKSSSYSVGISDLIANTETNNKIINAITEKKKQVKNLIDQTHLGIFENNTGKTNNVEFETQVNSILNKAQEEAGKIGRNSLAKDNRFVIMVNAGSKGKQLNIAQMISCLGQQNVDSKRIPYGFTDRTLPHYTKFDDSPEARGFVESSFIQGLTPQELFFHAMGGRVGLIDTAVKTSTTGYIQRRLIKGMEDLKVEYDMTVRNHMNKIIQFSYGDDGINTIKVENQHLPLVKMTLEEIYNYYQVPPDIIEESVFTKTALTKFRRQKKKLKDVSHKYINMMVQGRDELIKHVFKNENTDLIHIPVSFVRLINNTRNQLHIQSNSLVDITLLDAYAMIEKGLEHLKQAYVSPTRLFQYTYYYYLSPSNLVINKRFNKKALNYLISAIEMNYKKAIVAPGEMVGMISAQSIGEPTTQMTLNTFHYAGVASKSNVTRGVPRIEEILSLSENPKNPSLTVFLKESDQEDNHKAQEIMYTLEYTSLKDVAKAVSICFEPDDLSTKINEDELLLKEYHQFKSMVNECADIETDAETQKSKWIIRFEMDRASMLDRNISMDDIHFTIKNTYKQDVECIYSDFNADKLIFRIRMKELLSSKKKIKTLDQSDEIYLLKGIQENMLNNIILKGVKNIVKVNLMKLQNQLTKNNGNYESNPIWVLDTVGSNIKDILALDSINTKKTISNNIMEVYRTLGIEAARQTIYNELLEVIEFDGTYINSHHLSLLCDRMTATIRMVSIYRHGINNDNIGPIAKASFEETPEMFLRAAKHAQLDTMKGVSANVMCGQEGYFGTNSFQVLLDIDSMSKIAEKSVFKEEDLNELFDINESADPCANTNMNIQDNISIMNSKNTGDIDDDYDIDI
uniref:DNA-directed RNA polymerase n=1 Tax=viral metagenome TaxID=1070528 RepID=A0A6C0KIQ9_9ZZZZ